MPDVLIENPILNSPFKEPNRHFRFTDDGITNEIVESRRISSYFIPVAQPKKRGQLPLPTDWTQDRVQPNPFVDRIRRRVGLWRQGGYVGVTPTTARLLEYWTNPDRDNKLFFCQIEALETAIYIAEVAKKYGDVWIENDLRTANDTANPGLPRSAFKMATGTGKTVVMAMLIAWQALNKLANAQDARFSDTFLIITPGITIRDRLRVLLPNDPDNYYRQRDILPSHLLRQLDRAKILITNFHAFQAREKLQAARLTKEILNPGQTEASKETPGEMVRRVCRELGTKKHIVVINDEAHHCYRRKPDAEGVKLTRDERLEAKRRDEEARVWISGIEAVKDKIGVKTIYDLSATPFFLKGSGYPEGVLFPWVASDFSLIDAIEAGIVKVPRVPVADDSMQGEMPTYRNLWERIRDDLPRKGRKTDAVQGEPKLPAELQGAIHSLYSNYRKSYAIWESTEQAKTGGSTPPVFIVVCNNTNVSKLVFDYIAGWQKRLPEDTKVVVPGQLSLFSNEQNGGWNPRPNTILVDSQQLESGEAMSADFKKLAAVEIEEFKQEYRTRFPGRDVEKLTDEDLLREVMNTVGKKGKLGENIKCVVSVSMLTEGWDANTVTHILGVRAFGTQLLCEQVVGRGLRRMSHALDENGHFSPEYAEVYGVPFSFIPCSGSTPDPKPGPTPTRVRALDDRLACEITFPRIAGYRYEVGSERLRWEFVESSKLVLTTADLPTKTENAPIIGESSLHTLDDIRQRREGEVAFKLARHVLEMYFRDGDDNVKPWLFPQLLHIAKLWMKDYIVCKEDTFPQMILLHDRAAEAADRVYQAIVSAEPGTPRLTAVPKPYDSLGSTRYVDFDTTRPVWVTRPDKCHISHVVADTNSWEQKMAQVIEDMNEVEAYVKNDHLDFTIPYMLNGEQRQYRPDFLVRIASPAAKTEPLNLILEVSGENRKDKAIKTATTRDLWIPAVNNHGQWGQWAFEEITDPWDNAAETIRKKVAADVAQALSLQSRASARRKPNPHQTTQTPTNQT
jgi:type III restriction enzyme